MPGIDNAEADEELRAVVNGDTEWSLDPIVFKEIHKLHPNITVGLFASRVNNKLTQYMCLEDQTLMHLQ